jgi:3-hydroxybutyryl-CoA dehydratase
MDSKWKNGRPFPGPGEDLPIMEKTVTQEMINKWAEVSGDFNPLHVDPEFGKRTFFGSNIAHGPLILSFLIEMLTRCLGRPWISGGRLENIKIVSPVLPGMNLIVGGKVTNVVSEEGNMILECEVYVKRDDGKVIVTGNAGCRV